MSTVGVHNKRQLLKAAAAYVFGGDYLWRLLYFAHQLVLGEVFLPLTHPGLKQKFDCRYEIVLETLLLAAAKTHHQEKPGDRQDQKYHHNYGFAKNNGSWYIMRESSGAYRYSKGAPQFNGGGLYSDAWTDRANLTYDYIFEVFKK